MGCCGESRLEKSTTFEQNVTNTISDISHMYDDKKEEMFIPYAMLKVGYVDVILDLSQTPPKCRNSCI
jgi:hypothetical protein